ncbi:hypothetical protein CDAR_127121 [Caerostris darwini]|uniref:Uncharacterized protein n=1 Tax=Caerostris darwini TaxID=1538125 RepID=A0AAV4X9U7_9ARAC|nr:hypothetical protein CDAR_127121 [Caerostris darwini]
MSGDVRNEKIPLHATTNIAMQVILISLTPLLKAEENYKSNSQPQLHTLGTNFVPYAQAALGMGLLYGQGFPGVVGLGLPVGVYSSGQLNRALGAAGLGFHGGNYFGKQGLAKGAGGQEYGLQNGFAGLYDNKGGYGNQFIGGNSNIFSKEKIYSHNKNFGSGVKGGFGTGYGIQSGHQGLGGYGGYNGLGAFGEGGTHIVQGAGIGGFGNQLTSLHGKGLGTIG